MWKSLSLPFCILAIIPVSGLADWSIVSTFDDAGELSKITDVYYTFSYNGKSSIENGKWVVNPGTSNIPVELYSLLDLGQDISSTSNPVTVYFEVTQPEVDNGAGGTRKAVTNAFWGFSNKPPQSVTSFLKNSFNAFQRINISTDNLEGVDGNGDGATFELIPHQALQANVSYQIWIVMNFQLNWYSSYIKGGDWTDVTPLSNTFPWGFFVNPSPTDKVEHFMVTVSVDSGTLLDPISFDNVAIDVSGENLTIPDTPANDTTWAGFPIHDDFGNVNTGDWLGWVNVKHKPHVYVYALQKYLYMPEFLVDLEGGWTYAF